jgi:3-oxoacyl-[acyl-carrier protein] reductase
MNPLIRFQLQGKRALVTGAASGIGLATAQLLARAGARVAINDLPTPALETAVGALRAEGCDVCAAAGDLSRADTARAVAEGAAAALDGLDYLINNAGTPGTRAPIPPSDLDALSDEFWDKILRVNLLSAFWMSKALAPQLREARGAIVNTASISAFFGGASSTAYATAKSGLVGLTRELARGLAPAVRVNAIAPGYVNSNWDCSFGDIDAAAKTGTALQRVGQPHDYAEVIVWLCAGGGYITGQVLPVTGGAGL